VSGAARGRAAALAGLAAALLSLAPGAARGAVEVEARLERRTVVPGESVTLEVRVRGATGGIADPDLGVPPGVEILGSARQQSFQWINGRSSSETVFRYEIAALRAGNFPIGPIQVRVGGQIFESPAVELVARAARERLGAAGGAPATLTVDVSPADPWVGQPVLLRVRLVQRAPLAEDPQYAPPPTPGFWGERFRDPESYYADEGGRRVLVTETRARLYPLAAGEAIVGEATATLALATSGPGADPLLWFGRGLPRRELRLASEPVRVRVRALPPGAPPGFDGAVGRYEVAWRADRQRTALDVPFTVRLEVRGVGNLPLLRVPAFDPDGLETFAGAVDDSLGAPGALEPGRRAFQWTVLAQREGTLRVPAPAFAWFDPEAGVYRTLQAEPVTLEVGPALFSGDAGREAFPAAIAGRGADPGARGPEPWAWAVAGLALGAALALARGARRPAADAGERARQREWLRAVGLARGPDFWQAAARSVEWLAARGVGVDALKREIDAARYGGAAGSEERVRRRLVEMLGAALPPVPPAWPARGGAAALAAAAVTLCVLFGPRWGESGDVLALRRADDAARAGDLARARAAWEDLWRRGCRAPALAARLAWSEIREGRVGQAAAWVLRGERDDARDPALAWVAERVREGGGLLGAGPSRWPVRRLEWAVAALLAGALAGVAWPRRRAALALALAAVAAGAAFPAQGALWSAARRAVVLERVRLEGADVEVDPGQVVVVESTDGRRARVRLAGDVAGTLPSKSLEQVE